MDDTPIMCQATIKRHPDREPEPCGRIATKAVRIVGGKYVYYFCDEDAARLKEYGEYDGFKTDIKDWAAK